MYIKSTTVADAESGSPTCAYKLSVLLIFPLDEVGQHVLVCPAGGPRVRPAVVVVPAAAQVLHVVEQTRPSETFSRRPDCRLHADTADDAVHYLHTDIMAEPSHADSPPHTATIRPTCQH